MKKLECKKELLPFGGDGRFILGDNIAVYKEKLGDYLGKIQLIYLDPPFATGDKFTLKSSGAVTSAYEDTLDKKSYLDMMKSVLCASKELLKSDGSLFLHIDYRMSAHVRLLLDEIFGESNFRNELIWVYKSGGRATRYFPRKHDTIFYYAKGKRPYFDIRSVSVPRGKERRNHLKKSVDENGKIYFSMRSNGKEYRYYEDDPVFPCDVWDDINHLNQRDPERTGYATQKPEALLRRIVLCASREGDLVCDLFSGSGTLASVAAKTGRRWICVDNSPASLLCHRRRIVSEHVNTAILGHDTPASLDYDELLQLNAKVSVSREKSGTKTKLKIAASEPLSYIAVGKIDDGVFSPIEINMRPGKSPSIAFSDDTINVLQLVDTNGRQAFYQI